MLDPTAAYAAVVLFTLLWFDTTNNKRDLAVRRDCLHFPVLLHYQGHDELDVFEDSEALTALLCNCGHLLPFADRFIDSVGQVFVLNDQGLLETLGDTVSLAQFNQLLQKHFFALASSCAAKSSADSIASGMLALLASAER